MYKSITHAFNVNLGMMIDVISIEETFEERETGVEPIYIIKSNNEFYLEAHWLRRVTKLGRWIDYKPTQNTKRNKNRGECPYGYWLEFCRIKLNMNIKQFCKTIKISYPGYKNIITGKSESSKRRKERTFKLIKKANWKMLI